MLSGRSRRVLTRVGLAASGLVALSACNGSFEGGGSMPAPGGGALKAGLAMHVECSPTTQLVRGGIVYSDPTAQVYLTTSTLSRGLVGFPNEILSELGGLRLAPSIPGLPTEFTATCDNDATQGHYTGIYGRNIGVGSFGDLPTSLGTFTLDLNADQSCSSRYRATIAMAGGRYDGYRNSGCVSGMIRPLTVR